MTRPAKLRHCFDSVGHWPGDKKAEFQVIQFMDQVNLVTSSWCSHRFIKVEIRDPYPP